MEKKKMKNVYPFFRAFSFLNRMFVKIILKIEFIRIVCNNK